MFQIKKITESVSPRLTLQEESTDEAQQIKRAQKDPAFFAPLYEKYHEPVFRFLYQRLEDKEQAFDITSQVFYKALIKLGGYAFRGLPFSAWLFRIARNELYEYFRKSQTQRCIYVEPDGFKRLAEEIEEDKFAEFHDKMQDVLARLPEEELQYIEMRFFEKRAFAEIAAIMEITENNAKVKTYRILEKLKKLILKNND
jgi:RNA polymerase sigma-70 factor, ECF subfamily